MASASVLPATSALSQYDRPSSCPQCGHVVRGTNAEESQRRISDLEAQVKLLNTKAAAAVDKLADYEDEVRWLRSQCAQLQEGRNPSQDINQPGPADARSISPLSRFFSGSKKHTSRPSDPTNTLVPPMSGNHSNLSVPLSSSQNISPSVSAVEVGADSQQSTLMSLQMSLENEREMRQKAETSLNETQTELEELTAQLFGQANEMVATERRARAKLEERVKLLETRDTEKRRRLDRLEKALERIEKVRKLVVEEQEREMVSHQAG